MDPKKNQQQKNLRNWLIIAWDSLKNAFIQVFPGQKAWIGAGLGVFVVGYVFLVIMSAEILLPAGWFYFLLGIGLLPLLLLLGAAIVVGLAKLLWKLPAPFLIFLGAGVLLAIIGFQLFDLTGLLVGVIVVLVGGLSGAGISVFWRRGWKQLTSARKGVAVAGLVLAILGLAAGVIWLVNPFPTQDLSSISSEATGVQSLAATLSDPCLIGEYTVGTLTYGSGTDLRRAEFAEEVDIITDTVDGSAFVSNWTKLRSVIWGFDASELPLNGRVWYPEGEGPFPLVLVVHGNHLAEDYSDTGYAYLCELLASRGTICVSVDENFLNGSAVGDWFGYKRLSGENDLRGWLLLEHLALWKEMTKDFGSAFFGRVDLENIALVGHSRGGEAIVVAALFNDLPYYPDNAKVRFDYGFNIRSLVAIAPVDGQYKPAGEPIQLTDVNYLVLQGSHDMDVDSFDGMNTFERVAFSGDGSYFKSAIYIWGANHGQFNTIWGDQDLCAPRIWFFDRSALISAEDQMQVAKVVVSAFLETTLKGNTAYLPFFQNVQSGADWLPKNAYLNAYADSTMTYLTTFEEDMNVITGTMDGVRISTRGLTTWKEDHLTTKDGEMDENGAVLLGWRRSGEDVRYAITLPDEGLELTSADQLVFSVAQAERSDDEEEQAGVIDFTVVLIDSAGESAALPLSVQPQWLAEINRLSLFSDEKTSEPFLQSHLITLEDFLEVNPEIDLQHLAQVRFVFDLLEEGEIWLDNVGFVVISE